MNTGIAGMLGLALWIACGCWNAASKEAAGGAQHVTIGLIGDSTVAEESGWGPAFASRLDCEAKILNYAKNGAMLKSLSGRLDELLKEKPDFVLVQFGHNDQIIYGTEEYGERLTSYVTRIKAARATPILLSSVVRRSFDGNGKIVCNLVKTDRYEYKGTLDAYAEASRATAEKLDVPFIDLFAKQGASRGDREGSEHGLQLHGRRPNPLQPQGRRGHRRADHTRAELDRA